MVTPADTQDIETRSIAVIRGLAMDAPAAAKSGHQGTAMALAPLAHVLWTRVMNFDATAPDWADRDRFVLSAGHASILQYSMLHLLGYGLTLDDLKDFRQWGSATPGHPEYGHTTGVECTTGPLGQGLGNAVGMAIAEARLRAKFGEDVCDHSTWAIAGDGDLSEGVSHEAASLAGHLGLGHLNVIYDDNHITIDGPTELSLTDNAAQRFRAYGWHVVEAGEIGENLDAIESALLEAKAETSKPSLIIIRTHIGFPSPSLTDSPSAHGLAFGAEQITEAKAVMGIPDEPFTVPDDVLDYYRQMGTKGSAARTEWESRLAASAIDKTEWDNALAVRGAAGWIDALPQFEVGSSVATRSALPKALSAVAPFFPSLLSGGADLTGNTGVQLGDADVISASNPGGNQLHYGIREHGMGAIMNGLALHGGVFPVGGTFLVFSDYMRPAVRLAALMGTKTLFAWSHDSVGVGEDGPTHQPVEHVAALRTIPDLDVIRPADANECVHATRLALEGDRPVALIMTRQNVPTLENTSYDGVAAGGYTLKETADADLTIVATGSEVSLALEAAAELDANGTPTRVVSLPCWERFERQSPEYRAGVLPSSVPTLAVEAQVSFGWHKWADEVVGIDRFGASAPGGEALAKLGMNVDNVVSSARDLLAR